MPTLIADVGGATSNSYCDLAFADAYAANQSWAASWTALTEDEKTVALITATQWMEMLSYAGTRCDATQRLAWPRTGATCDGIASDCASIPYKIKQTEVELAWQAHQNPGAIIGGGGSTPSGVFVKRQKLGSLEVEYDQFDADTGASSCSTCDIVLSKFPFVKPLLGCWLITTGGTSRLMYRVRS